MGFLDDPYIFHDPYIPHRRWRGEPFVPGIVRMDRAILYIRQRLNTIIAEIDSQATKTLADTGYYRIMPFLREAQQLAGMSGDRQFVVLLMETLQPLTTRTPRKDALSTLHQLRKRLETYEPPPELAGFEDGHGKSGTLEDALGEDPRTKVTDQQLADARSVFVIMPFAADFSDVWKGGIQRAAQAEGFNPIRVDMINRSTNITDDIVASIEKSHLAIVDVTKNNPNVMFELGYAIAKSKKNIIISQSADYLPFDIRNIRTIVYANTWSGIEELKGRIQEFLRESAPPKHTRRTAKS